MQIDPEIFLAIALPVIAGVVWMVRLEGRINVTDAQFTEIIRRLQRIEQQQDDAR